MTGWFTHPDSLGSALWQVAIIAMPIAASATAVGYGFRAVIRARNIRTVNPDDLG
ncbi:hypothetical protein [Microbacterium gorillae]|uniref:hypothetical protein n=1 Tax=Microbacterium gorillae TaxID=1231063 RepID=UPI003D993C91